MLPDWRTFVPKRKGKDLGPKSKICSLHFKSSCFEGKIDPQVKDDSKIEIATKNKLKKDAIPSIFPASIPSYLVKKQPEKRKPPTQRENVTVRTPRTKKIKTSQTSSDSPSAASAFNGEQPQVPCTAVANDNIQMDLTSNENTSNLSANISMDCEDSTIGNLGEPGFIKMIKEAQLIHLPSSWELRIERTNEAFCVSETHFSREVGCEVVKTILFQKNCLPVLVVRGRRVKSKDFKVDELTLENLVPFLNALDENYKLCMGATNHERAIECSGLLPALTRKIRCRCCQDLFKKITVEKHRKKKKKKIWNSVAYTSMRQKLAVLKTSVFLAKIF